MTATERNNVESILRKAQGYIQKDREKMISRGEIEREIATTAREHEMFAYFKRNHGIDVSGKLVEQPGISGFVIVISE